MGAGQSPAPWDTVHQPWQPWWHGGIGTAKVTGAHRGPPGHKGRMRPPEAVGAQAGGAGGFGAQLGLPMGGAGCRQSFLVHPATALVHTCWCTLAAGARLPIAAVFLPVAECFWCSLPAGARAPGDALSPGPACWWVNAFGARLLVGARLRCSTLVHAYLWVLICRCTTLVHAYLCVHSFGAQLWCNLLVGAQFRCKLARGCRFFGARFSMHDFWCTILVRACWWAPSFRCPIFWCPIFGPPPVDAQQTGGPHPPLPPHPSPL